jgi:hypothetical protein
VPSGSCECRASEPTAPAERPAQRTTNDRAEADAGDVLSVFVPAPRSASSRPAYHSPTESPPKSPLYLRTSRLLI